MLFLGKCLIFIDVPGFIRLTHNRVNDKNVATIYILLYLLFYSFFFILFLVLFFFFFFLVLEIFLYNLLTEVNPCDRLVDNKGVNKNEL